MVVDVDPVCLDGLLALDACAVGNPELPVGPGAREQVTVELPLRQSVSLVRAGVVEGVNTARRSDETDASAVDLDHLHRAVGDVVEVGDVSESICASMFDDVKI